VWLYIAEAWELRNHPNVLVITYEDMKGNLAREVKRLAAFMGVELTPSLEARVLELGSHAWMREHVTLFDEHLIAERQLTLGRFGAAGPCTPVAKVSANGRSGAGRERLSAESKALMARLWSQNVERRIGLSSYGALRAALQTTRGD